ncbi:C1 family peptidase, partial [uncultured Muribaculum sp.]
MNGKVLIMMLLAAGGINLWASAPKGAITPEMMSEIRSAYEGSSADKAIHNAIANNGIDELAVNAANKNGFDTNFSHRVKSKGITNQRSSGRCWLFTGLNVLRAQMMSQHNLPKLEL